MVPLPPIVGEKIVVTIPNPISDFIRTVRAKLPQVPTIVLPICALSTSHLNAIRGSCVHLVPQRFPILLKLRDARRVLLVQLVESLVAARAPCLEGLAALLEMLLDGRHFSQTSGCFSPRSETPRQPRRGRESRMSRDLALTRKGG